MALHDLQHLPLDHKIEEEDGLRYLVTIKKSIRKIETCWLSWVWCENRNEKDVVVERKLLPPEPTPPLTPPPTPEPTPEPTTIHDIEWFSSFLNDNWYFVTVFIATLAVITIINILISINNRHHLIQRLVNGHDIFQEAARVHELRHNHAETNRFDFYIAIVNLLKWPILVLIGACCCQFFFATKA